MSEITEKNYESFSKKELFQALTRLKNEKEEDSSKTKHFLESIFDNSPTAMIICEAPDGRISYINDAVWNFRGKTDAKMTGITVEEYIGTWKEFYPDGTQLTGADMPLGRSLLTGEVVKNEQIIVELDDGTRKWAAAWSGPIYDDCGEIIAAIVLFYDITVQKETEQQLKETEKMASLNHLVKGIAHEMNTPVGNNILLQGYLEKSLNRIMDLIQENNYSKGTLNDELKKALRSSDMMKHNANKIQGLVHKFKELSVIDKPTNIRKTNISECIDLCIKKTKRRYDYDDIVHNISCDKDIFITLDRSKLETILDHLLSNSYEHGLTNGVGVIDIMVTNSEGKLELNYKDNGVGLDDDLLSHLFTPFYTTRFSGQKTGLGMTILYNTVTQCFDGSVTCSSELGMGVEFNITLNV